MFILLYSLCYFIDFIVKVSYSKLSLVNPFDYKSCLNKIKVMFGDIFHSKN